MVFFIIKLSITLHLQLFGEKKWLPNMFQCSNSPKKYEEKPATATIHFAFRETPLGILAIYLFFFIFLQKMLKKLYSCCHSDTESTFSVFFLHFFSFLFYLKPLWVILSCIFDSFSIHTFASSAFCMMIW